MKTYKPVIPPERINKQCGKPLTTPPITEHKSTLEMEEEAVKAKMADVIQFPTPKLSELEKTVTPEQREAMLKAGRAVKMDDMTRVQEGMDKHDDLGIFDKDLHVYEIIWSHGVCKQRLYKHKHDAKAVCAWMNDNDRTWYQRLTGMKFLVRTRRVRNNYVS